MVFDTTQLTHSNSSTHTCTHAHTYTHAHTCTHMHTHAYYCLRIRFPLPSSHTRVTTTCSHPTHSTRNAPSALHPLPTSSTPTHNTPSTPTHNTLRVLPTLKYYFRTCSIHSHIQTHTKYIRTCARTPRPQQCSKCGLGVNVQVASAQRPTKHAYIVS